MLAKFKDSFRKNNTYEKLPQEILQQLDKRLPEGFKYVQVEMEKEVVVIPVDEKKRFPLTIKVPKEVEDNPSRIGEYLYKTQTTLKITPNEEGKILINNVPIAVEDIIVFPLETREIIPSSVTLCIMPEPFPPPFSLEVEFDGEKKCFLMKRVPYSDMDKAKYEAINENVIKFSYTIDERNKNMNMSVYLELEKAVNIEEVIKSAKLYFGFLKGKIKIGDTLVEVTSNHIPNQNFIATLHFWERVYQVMQVIDKEIPPTFPIRYEDALWIEKLYRCLVENNYFKEKINSKSITLEFRTTLDEQTINDFIGKTVAFCFTREITINMFNMSFDLFVLQIMPKVSIDTVSVIDKEKHKYEAIIQKGKESMEKVSRLFLDENEMLKCLENIGLNKMDFKSIDEIKIELESE